MTLDEHLATPEFLQDPYPTYDLFRAESPVHWSDAWQCWLLSRYDDVASALRDYGSFSSVGTTARFLDQLPPKALKKITPLYEHFTTGLVRLDPPDHTRVRSITNKAFTPRVVEHLRSRIEQVVGERIDAIIPTGKIDLIADLAYPLPTTIIADMFGFPLEDRAKFKRLSDQIVAFHGTGGADTTTVLRSQEALLEARAWMSNLIDERRRKPREDLLSRLANAEEQGTRLSEAELFSTCVTFLIGGHETTTNLIGNGMLALLQHPDQLQRLEQSRELIAPAIEEMLRYDAPTQRAHRIAAANIELHGKTIRQGDFVQLVIGSANHDPEQFDHPERFDIGRQGSKHLSFGLGPHYCPGAPLARLEAQISISTLLNRLPNLRLTDGAQMKFGPNNFFRGLEALPLVFDPA